MNKIECRSSPDAEASTDLVSSAPTGGALRVEEGPTHGLRFRNTDFGNVL